VLKGALASLEGEISQVQTIGTHLVYLVEIKNIILSDAGHGLIYFSAVSTRSCWRRKPPCDPLALAFFRPAPLSAKTPKVSAKSRRYIPIREIFCA
jgi:hypothetical protein